MEKKRRRGPQPLPFEQRRTECVWVRMTPAELARLDELRSAVRMQRGAYLRAAALDRLPPVVPEINRQAWAGLARLGANLNQLARAYNVTGDVNMIELRVLLDELRRSLIGARVSAAAADEAEADDEVDDESESD